VAFRFVGHPDTGGAIRAESELDRFHLAFLNGFTGDAIVIWQTSLPWVERSHQFRHRQDGAIG
jgi:hypothetical protein